MDAGLHNIEQGGSHDQQKEFPHHRGRRHGICRGSGGLWTGSSTTAGETGSAENPVTINYTWWGNDDRAERTRKAIALFESKNPDIKVNGNFTDFAGYWQKRATEAAGGGLPDVMQWDLSYLRDYGQRNQLLDLGTVKINTDAFEKSLLPSGQIKGKTYGIPTSTNAFAVYYDPAKLASLGIAEPDGTWTYKEFNAFLAEVGAKGNGALFGGTDYTGVWWMFNVWLRQNNIEAFTEDGKLGFTKDDLKKWWNTHRRPSRHPCHRLRRTGHPARSRSRRSAPTSPPRKSRGTTSWPATSLTAARRNSSSFRFRRMTRTTWACS